MLPKDFEALFTGYNRRIKYQSSELRRATFITILPHVKDLNFDKFCRDFWPIESSDAPVKKEIKKVSNDLFRQIMKAHQNKDK